ncbi:TetM/TetW/TetO/TetS family tetracycline resistance ribosomal protection protein [Paenibacillus mucilaginosus]|nr:TetM/TetW/TetO/TetS family tetracycline resistance ribosomal protection protein [Paenibacillus caseinilyticus]MCZ8521206.1 TetM/TetW/TetO/TetS family tetracycline resistance ribosomal protection protein [Paenibacillus caseinilyticus]
MRVQSEEGAVEQELRNVGIFAHVDAGKTTTTEQMLFRSGRIRTLGSVDAGTAQTDSMEVERERGISVRSAVTRYAWQGVAVNLVDTPGHVDFLSEVERSLRVMDGAILVVSAVEGVQAQTEVIWQALRELRIPTLLYINKLDRTGADPLGTLAGIKLTLSPDAVPVQAPLGVEDGFSGVLDLLGLSGEECAGDRGPGVLPYADLLAEAAADRDAGLMLSYMEHGGLLPADMLPVIAASSRQGGCFPVLFGASSRGIGIAELLGAVNALLPPPSSSAGEDVSGVVFKLDKDPAMGRIAYVRLYGGVLRNRDTVSNHTQGLQEKVTQIRRIEGSKTEDTGMLGAGDMAAVYGLSRARIGDILGCPAGVPGERPLAVPLLTVQAYWASDAAYPAVVAAFQELADEDPLLDLQWMQEDRELHLKVMGPIQMEVLQHILLSRFGQRVTFGAPSVIYKETPASSGEGFVAYTMPKPCWAVLRFRIEPGERGSGLQYASLAREERLLESYQNEVARRVPEALRQGLHGWEVTDLKVTLLEGEHHVWHTHPLDFVVATPMGIMDGLARTGTRLLEPLLRFRLSAPEEAAGRLLHELAEMRASFETAAGPGGRMEMEGLLPVASSLDFPSRLGSLTKGRGVLSTAFAGYQEAPAGTSAVRPRRGVNPLDQAKYILAVRSALSG